MPDFGSRRFSSASDLLAFPTRHPYFFVSSGCVVSQCIEWSPVESAIELRQVTFDRRKSFEIRDLTLSVPTGSIYGFLGPNGSGKTTTIRMIVGMLRAQKGSIKVLGHDIPREAARAMARLGYVPEKTHLHRRLTIKRAIEFHSAFYRSWDSGVANRLLDRFGLDPAQRIMDLSKGQTGQVLILLALAQRPELLVLDEPTDGLDPVVRRGVLDAILDFVSGAGCTVLISSHLVHELEQICDWVGVMDNGNLVAELPMHSFKNGIKRLRVMGAPSMLADSPFRLLVRRRPKGSEGMETWIVRGWQDPMTQYFDGIGAELSDVVDLNLEEAFVELLNSSRVESLLA